MKVCFRKKRGLCTLLLILCCGSGWSLNQRHGRSAQQTGQRCLREDFYQLLTSPSVTNMCCKYADVDRADTAGHAFAASRQNSEMNATVVKGEVGDENLDDVVSQSDTAVVTQLESTLTVSRDDNDGDTYPGEFHARNSSENATQNEAVPELRQAESADRLEDSSNLLPNGTHKQNETENATASILNGSIIQDKEAMPSFDEWKKIRLEQEMQEPPPSSSKEPEHREGFVVKAAERKRGRRNYASIECGAKLVAANVGAEGASKVLLEAQDEYMLNPCSSLQKGGMWFIVELCESIHPTHIELANFELYSSTGKEFVVYMSDHYQSREWTQVGRYEMAHLKSVQSFPLDAPGFGKAIKVEFVSIYENSQYYCPLSLVRVFGNSMVDDYEEKVSEDAQPTPEPLGDEAAGDVEPTPSSSTAATASADGGAASTTVIVDENMMSRAKQAMFNIINSVSKAVSGTRTLDSNCSDCSSTNESGRDTAPFDQLFDNCFELTNLSGLEGHLWPSMKCRFAEVTNLQRSCRPLPIAPSIRIEPSPLKLLSNLSPPISTSSPVTALPSITMTAEMISPTTVAEAEKGEEPKKTQTVVPVKLVADSKNETPQAQPSAVQNMEIEADPLAVVRPNAVPKIPPLVHSSPSASAGQPTAAAPNKAANQVANQPTKENLFSRFENRIKKLELHMNLSGTYLEELSKRYRNQMEEMQAAFNKTVAALNMEAKKGLERDQNQQQALAVLQEKLTAVTESLRRLEIESDSLWWRLLLVYLGLLVVSIAIFIVLFHLILRRTITTYVWSEHIERRVLEVLEQERRLRRESPRKPAPQPSTDSGKPEPNVSQQDELDKAQPEEADLVVKVEPKNDEIENRAVKSESSCAELTTPELKADPSDEPQLVSSTEPQVDSECSQSVSQKRKRGRKKPPREDFAEVNTTVVSSRHLATTEIALSQGDRLSGGDRERKPSLVTCTSENDDDPSQRCTKCVISCCTHALLRH